MKGNLDINEYWEQAHKMCHIVGSKVVGKALCGSTANPPNKGGKNYEKFYNNSKLTSRDNSVTAFPDKNHSASNLYIIASGSYLEML